MPVPGPSGSRYPAPAPNHGTISGQRFARTGAVSGGSSRALENPAQHQQNPNAAAAWGREDGRAGLMAPAGPTAPDPRAVSAVSSRAPAMPPPLFDRDSRQAPHAPVSAQPPLPVRAPLPAARQAPQRPEPVPAQPMAGAPGTAGGAGGGFQARAGVFAERRVPPAAHQPHWQPGPTPQEPLPVQGAQAGVQPQPLQAGPPRPFTGPQAPGPAGFRAPLQHQTGAASGGAAPPSYPPSHLSMGVPARGAEAGGSGRVAQGHTAVPPGLLGSAQQGLFPGQSGDRQGQTAGAEPGKGSTPRAQASEGAAGAAPTGVYADRGNAETPQPGQGPRGEGAAATTDEGGAESDDSSDEEELVSSAARQQYSQAAAAR